ncbi:MAG: hypothetical protein MZV49_04580 [Rhodopseudomonas palustris]|nr:hypothetical protein [Rhodopseudomonas palustris]
MLAPRTLRVRAQVLGSENALINLVPKDGLVERVSRSCAVCTHEANESLFCS